MVFDAVVVVFVPAIAILIVFDILFWLNGRIKDRVEGWRKRGLKSGVSAVASLWIAFALRNAQNWGVNQANLNSVMETFDFVPYAEELSGLSPILFLLVASFVIPFVLMG